MDCQSVFCLSMAFDTIDTGPLANGIVVSSLTLVSGHLFGPSQFWQMWLNLMKFLVSSFEQDEETRLCINHVAEKELGAVFHLNFTTRPQIFLIDKIWG